jgi:hypothetical protein
MDLERPPLPTKSCDMNSAVAMTIADRAYAYDNSIDNRDPKKLFRTKSGIIFRIYSDLKLHEWGQLLLTTSEAGQ